MQKHLKTAKAKAVGLIWGFPHGSKNGNLAEPPTRDGSSIGRALQREGILLLNALTTWTPQVDSV